MCNTRVCKACIISIFSVSVTGSENRTHVQTAVYTFCFTTSFHTLASLILTPASVYKRKTLNIIIGSVESNGTCNQNLYFCNVSSQLNYNLQVLFFTRTYCASGSLYLKGTLCK